MLKKVLFVAAVMMMMFVGCAGSLAVEIADDFDHEFETEFKDALNIPDEVTVSKRVNGDTVYSERVNTNDDHHSVNFDEESIDIDDLENIQFDFGDDGLTFEVEGTNRQGESVKISADLTGGNESTVIVDITD